MNSMVAEGSLRLRCVRQHMESVCVHKEKIRVPATRNGGKI